MLVAFIAGSRRAYKEKLKISMICRVLLLRCSPWILDSPADSRPIAPGLNVHFVGEIRRRDM